MRDFLSRETTHLAQRERNLRVGAQSRVATGEDEPQAIIFDTVLVHVRRLRRLEPVESPSIR